MNRQTLFDPSLLSRLCLTLLHSLWAVALLAMAAWLIGRLWRNPSVERSYALHVAAIILSLAVLPVIYAVVGEDASVGGSPIVAPPLLAQPSLASSPQAFPASMLDIPAQEISKLAPFTEPVSTATKKTTIAWNRIAPWLAGTYAIGVLLMLARLLTGIWRAHRLGSRATPITEGPLLESLRSLSQRWSLRVAPLLARAEHVVVPKVVGFLKPTILLPTSAITGLSTDELEMILAHELAHVRRNDMWVNLLQRLAEVVLFFNPALWYLSRKISTLREYCCDEMTCRAMSGTEAEPKLRYATALLRVVELAQPETIAHGDLASLAASGRSPSELRRRVARLLGEPLREPLRVSRAGMICIVLLGILPFVISTSWQAVAQTSKKTAEDSLADSRETSPDQQEMKNLSIRVVGPEGKPVAGAEVIPWALRSSQGHGRWRANGFDESNPPTFKTDQEGRVDVLYPVFKSWKESVSTTQVTLSIDHPEYVYISHENVEVPREDTQPYEVTIERGVALEVTPIIDGKPASLEGIEAMWSDGRSWMKGSRPEVAEEGTLRIPSLTKGKAQLLLIRLQDEVVTHFSPIVDFDLKERETVKQTMELHPRVTVRGRLSANVPRPVKHGRVKVQTIPTTEIGPGYEVHWRTWAPVAADGTFVIQSWPADRPMQLVALCNGYMAKSGEQPAMVTPERAKGSYLRAQVFLTPAEDTIEVAMEPRGRCEVETVDANGKPLVGIAVNACPNVGWWNGGAQIYCHPLVRSKRLLLTQDYFDSFDDEYGYPFGGDTDASGRVTFELPVGKESLNAGSDDYELPISILRGRRVRRITIVAGQTAKVRLVMQPKGTDQLGDWDRLRNLVLGCDEGQCQDISKFLLKYPHFTVKIMEFRKRFENADDPQDPLLLRDTYTAIADALVEMGHKQEAVTWQRKAEDQEAKIPKVP